jgi:hypothetical protein
MKTLSSLTALPRMLLRGMMLIVAPFCCRYQPYQNRDLQQLATVCSFLLVLMSAVLLRSQSLISSARQINFNPQQPGVRLYHIS